jgi:hypothetical protein
MKNTKKWTVECGKSKRFFDDRDEVVKFIAENPTRVTNIRHYNRLTSSAIQVFKEGLRLKQNLD